MEPIRTAILTVSDRSARCERVDLSGPALAEKALELGWEVIESALVADEKVEIEPVLRSWSDSGSIDLILTTGGTGFALRDITPEATLAVIERQAPGLVEAMRFASSQVTPHAMLARSVAGIRKRTLIVNLPGSPKAALENLAVILPAIPHAVQLLRTDPNAESGHQSADQSPA